MFSIVIPLYNKELSIINTLISVRNQNFTEWECIIVDDGSTDSSFETVQSWLFAVSDSRFILIHKENGGVSSARNVGIKNATKPYVSFLDGDDLWAPNYLDTLKQLIHDFPGKGIYGIGCVPVSGNYQPTDILSNSYYRGLVDEWSYDHMSWTGSSATALKSNIMKVGLFDERLSYGEDKDMWFRLLLLSGGASDCIPLAFYQQDSENRAMNREIELDRHLVYYIEKYQKYRNENIEFRRFFDQEMIYSLYPFLMSKKWKKDAKRISRCFDYSILKKSMSFRMKFPYCYFYAKRLIAFLLRRPCSV